MYKLDHQNNMKVAQSKIKLFTFCERKMQRENGELYTKLYNFLIQLLKEQMKWNLSILFRIRIAGIEYFLRSLLCLLCVVVCFYLVFLLWSYKLHSYLYLLLVFFFASLISLSLSLVSLFYSSLIVESLNMRCALICFSFLRSFFLFRGSNFSSWTGNF